jgi:hypothetical protein
MAKVERRTNPVHLRHGMSIGSNAAESDDAFLVPCFVHYPPVEQCTNVHSSGMILLGRTGAGKTAILKHIENSVDRCSLIDPSEIAMSYVANSDALNFLQVIGADLDLLFQVLWKHVICIEMIRLRFDITDEVKSQSVFSKLADKFGRNPRR